MDCGPNDNGPKGFRVEPKMQTRQARIRSGRTWVRRSNLDRQDDLKQLNFRRSINRNSLEGMKVAKLFLQTFSLKILSTQRRKKGISRGKDVRFVNHFYCTCFYN